MGGRLTESGRRIVVTGGAGFIGSSLVRALAASGYRVTILDDGRACGFVYLTGSDVQIVREGLEELSGTAEIRSLLEGATAVIHLAARPGVPASVADPVTDRLMNVDLSLALLDAARQAGVGRFIFASSNAAVGAASAPITEVTLPRPTTPYGAGKLAVEGYLRAYAESYGMATVALRFSNAYGPFSLHKRSVVASFLIAALRGRALTMFGDGSQGRDLVHADDLAALVLACLEAPSERVAGRVIQAGSGQLTSVGELASRLAAMADEVSVEHAPARPGDVAGSASDVSLAHELLGWAPRVELDEGLEKTAHWFRAALANEQLAPLADR